MASDTEYRLREIIQEAMKFMKHAKRERLTPSDINSALRLRHVEQLFGYSSSDAVRFQRAVDAKGLFFLYDEDVKLSDVVTAPLPKVPREVIMTAHWLAIEGVQPAVPQNPIASETDSSSSAAPVGAAAVVAAANDGSGGGGGVDARPLVKHVLSEELRAYFANVTAAVHAFAEPPGADAAARQNWQRIVAALRRDGGVQQLVPYFTQFVADEVHESLRQLPVLRAALELCDALLHNGNVSVEPYLHQLMPPLLTCLVGKRVSATAADDHWALRDYAATLVALICDRFGRNYATLQPRVTKTLLHALLDPTKSLATHYGAIRGLTELGAMVIEVLLMPNVVAYVDALRPHLEHGAPQKADAQRCFDALRVAATRHVAHQPDRSGKRRQASAAPADMAVDEPQHDGALAVPYSALYDIFGESLHVAARVDDANLLTL